MPKEKSFVPKARDPGKKRPNAAENNVLGYTMFEG